MASISRIVGVQHFSQYETPLGMLHVLHLPPYRVVLGKYGTSQNLINPIDHPATAYLLPQSHASPLSQDRRQATQRV